MVIVEFLVDKYLKKNDILTFWGAAISWPLRDCPLENYTEYGKIEMKKIRAAGDETDGWEARSEDEIRAAGLWDAVDFAIKEIDNTDSAMIFKEGLEWTKTWYSLSLDKFTDAKTAQPIDEKTADELLGLADKNGRVNDLLNEVMAAQIEQGLDLPQNLKKRLVASLRSSVATKKKSEEPKPQNWSRDYMINHVVGLVCTFYDLGRKRGKEKNDTIAASDIIFHALPRKTGTHLNFGTIQNIIFDPDSSRRPLSERNRKNFVDVKTEILLSIFDDYDD